MTTRTLPHEAFKYTVSIQFCRFCGDRNNSDHQRFDIVKMYIYPIGAFPKDSPLLPSYQYAGHMFAVCKACGGLNDFSDWGYFEISPDQYEQLR